MKQIETERKYIIVKPDIAVLEKQKNYTSSEIIQIYLSNSEKTHRIRKRVFADGRVEYTENTKKRISSMSSVESEDVIDVERFNVLKNGIEPFTSPLHKTRITFELCGKIFEIDMYPEWKYSCILEIELGREDEQIHIPSFIKVIKEVTGEKAYSNHQMAHKFPCELNINAE